MTKLSPLWTLARDLCMRLTISGGVEGVGPGGGLAGPGTHLCVGEAGRGDGGPAAGDAGVEG